MEVIDIVLVRMLSQVLIQEELVIIAGSLQTVKVRIVEVQLSLEEEILDDHPTCETPFKVVKMLTIMLVSLRDILYYLGEIIIIVVDSHQDQEVRIVDSAHEQVIMHL